MAPGPGREHLGRVGRRERRPRPCIRLPVALLAGPGRPAHRPVDERRRGDTSRPRLAPPHRVRVERRRYPRHGSRTVPRAVPVLRRGREAQLQLTREPRDLPTLYLDPAAKELDGFDLEHVTIEGYDPHPGIKAPIAI